MVVSGGCNSPLSVVTSSYYRLLKAVSGCGYRTLLVFICISSSATYGCKWWL